MLSVGTVQGWCAAGIAPGDTLQRDVVREGLIGVS